MTPAWRLWIVFCAGAATLVTVFGMQPQLSSLWWPVAGLWLAAAWAPYGLSVWASGCLLLVGLMTDLMTEAPLGAWPLALLCAYGVALVAWDRQPPISVVAAEAIAVIGGVVAAGLALAAAGNIAGQGGFDRGGVMGDLFVTALIYPAARFILIPKSIRTARR